MVDHPKHRDEAPQLHVTWNRALDPGTSVAIVDIDGVLSDAAGRQHFLEGATRRWRAFFEACGEDPVIEETRRLLSALHAEVGIALVTARPAWVHSQTVEWLERFDVRWDGLVMRGVKDQRSSAVYKSAALDVLLEFPLEPVFAVEDDLRNVAMFRDRGVPTLYRHSGYYE